MPRWKSPELDVANKSQAGKELANTFEGAYL
jgi:hypothetical protein